MKRLIFVFLLLLFVNPGFAQVRYDTIALNDWLIGNFFSDKVFGLRSMNDGEHYTSISRSKSSIVLVT